MRYVWSVVGTSLGAKSLGLANPQSFGSEPEPEQRIGSDICGLADGVSYRARDHIEPDQSGQLGFVTIDIGRVEDDALSTYVVLYRLSDGEERDAE